MLRKMTKNLMLMHREATVNEMEINLTGKAERMELEEYIEKFVMRMQEDAQGAVLSLAPLVLRANVQIFNIDKSSENLPLDSKNYNLEEHKASEAEFEISIPSDGLDLHKTATLAVMRNTGHYNALYCKIHFPYSL